MMNEPIRINKYLSASGVMSRRRADSFIISGRITVNGEKAVPGMMVDGSEEIRIDGRLLKKDPDSERKVVLLYNKPRGIVTSTVNQGKEKNNIVDAVSYPTRVFPIGRLDKDSEGLILLTNDGDLIDHMMRGANLHEKEYIVTVDKEVTEETAERLRKGIYIPELKVKTRPCKVVIKDKVTMSITLTQGLNRQIRRMCEQAGLKVKKLKRVRVMNVTLSGLKPGQYRELTEEEIRGLRI